MNLYISNLGERITDESLRAIFSTHGRVLDARITRDRSSGYSKDFALIEMPNEKEALTAISLINGAVVDGRSISVREARPGKSG